MIDVVPGKERPSPSEQVVAMLDRLVDFETPRLLTIEEPELDLIRPALEEAGVDFEVLDNLIQTVDDSGEEPQELDITVRQALALSQIRRSDQGAGPAVVAMLGQNRYQQLFELAVGLGVRDKAPRLKDQLEETRARGLTQFLRLTLAFGAGSINREDFVAELNQRLFNGHANVIKKDKSLTEEAKEAKLAALSARFGGLTKKGNRSSIMPSSLVEFWQVMIDSRL